ncbi:E3 ubiquitin-protein ligase SINAT3 [Camellia lanceoleosa]|uniref:E3 ubiquitin-protein ligase SINAT3 n=1 Tax=Camellia lanceoleosa TaxID=1840588 RepID=A0ACC0INT6_9ERIC|nr:E3 ubiquitin-protein ligase SINAT3 [Camellia lanceoleosa]
MNMELDSIECVSDGMDEDEIHHHRHPQFSSSKPHNNVVSSAIHPTTSVHELLECPVCTNSMYPPIHQCHNGHTLCSTCKVRVQNRCPTCRQELGDIRCLALEKVAESLELPCNKLKHQAICNFRPYNCPYAGSECSVVGDIPYLVTHLRDDHKVDMHSGCTFNHRYVKSNPREVENATWMLTVFNCFGQYFCLHFEAFQLGMAPVYMAFLRFMGDETDARNYSYSLEVGGNGRKLIWEGTPRSIRDSHRKVRDSHDGLVIQRNMALFFSGGDRKELKLRVTGRIWKEQQNPDGGACIPNLCTHFGRPTNRRNSLRKKLIEEEQQQVRHRSQNPVLDYDNSEIYYSNLGNDSVEKSKFSSNYGVSEGSVDSDSIEELKSKGLGESVLWNKLESWVDQYKNDSEFWGIGFNPIFTVFQDSGGNVERVVVNEDEILRRSGIEMEMYKKKEIEDLTEVNSKISHAKFLAREMENGNCVFSKSSSVAKFIVSGKHRGFDNAIRGLALRPGLSLKLPRIGIMVLCGLFVFWAMKAIFSGGKEKVEYTRLEKEIMRRKMKARKEKEKLVMGSVEVIQDPMEAQIERPRLNEQDLMNSITKLKASSNTLALHESSSDRAVSKDLDSKIQEIKAMARQAREIERRDPSPGDTDGGDDLTVNELTDEMEVVKQHEGVVILPNDLSIEYSGQIRGVNGTSTPMSFNDVENNDTEFSEEVLVENIDTQTSSTSSMKVSNDGESTTREGVVSLPNGLSNEDSDQVEGDDGTLTPKFNDLKNNDARFGEEVLLENSGTQTASTSIMKVSNDGESTIQDVINRESAVNMSDMTNVSQSSNTFESHSRKLKRSFGTKTRVIRSVKEAREFLSQKRNKQVPNQEYQDKTVPEGAAILSIEREKDTNSNARKRIDKDNEVSGTTILDGTSDFAPAINASKDSALKRKESVPAGKSDPQAADEGCKEMGPSVLVLSRERKRIVTQAWDWTRTTKSSNQPFYVDRQILHLLQVLLEILLEK